MKSERDARLNRANVAGLLLLVLIGVATGLRFINVTQSPPGFYIDEAAISAQVICLRQSGANLQQQAWPLFTQVLGGGYLTPSYAYPALAWTAMFGDSIASFRSFTAFFSVLFIFGAFVLGRRLWKSDRAAYSSALSACLSPWVFQFARIAWDPALAPAYMIWAFAFLFVEPDSKTRKLQLVASGVLFSVAAYCYPPLRVQLAIMLPFALIGLAIKQKRYDTWLTVVAATLVSLPLIAKTLSGEIQGRFQMLSVFNHNYLLGTYGDASKLNGLRALLGNIASMLSPTFLLLHGDSNLRHSTGQFGIWSWLDALAIASALATALAIALKRSQKKIAWFEVSFCIVGYLAGLLPAAMTWESNPHALRSFGAVMFLVIGSGGALAMLWRSVKALRPAIVGVAFTSFLLFVHVYFVDYPRVARVWFDADVTELGQQLEDENRLGDMNEILKSHGADYDPMAVTYYQLAGKAIRCPLTK